MDQIQMAVFQAYIAKLRVGMSVSGIARVITVATLVSAPHSPPSFDCDSQQATYF
jgi:hypothetical protein